MAYQLRDYTVRAGALGDFVREWRERIVPLRQQFGFEVVGAWQVEDENRFVWILRYDGPEGYEARDREYYASPERASLDPNPARHIEEMRLALMEDVP